MFLHATLLHHFCIFYMICHGMCLHPSLFSCAVLHVHSACESQSILGLEALGLASSFPSGLGAALASGSILAATALMMQRRTGGVGRFVQL